MNKYSPTTTDVTFLIVGEFGCTSDPAAAPKSVTAAVLPAIWVRV